jgi:hypothetical protein
LLNWTKGYLQHQVLCKWEQRCINHRHFVSDLLYQDN